MLKVGNSALVVAVGILLYVLHLKFCIAAELYKTIFAFYHDPDIQETTLRMRIRLAWRIGFI
jgi:hypothetical protein